MKITKKERERIHKTAVKKWGCENLDCKWSFKGFCKRLNAKEKCILPGKRKIPTY